MNFSDLFQEVVTITARPDLVAETELAIRSATIKAHSIDYFSKDIHETLIEAESPDYIHGIDYISIIPNFRSIKYLRKYDKANAAVGEFISVITPDEVLDSYGRDKTDVCYIAGRVLEIRSSTKIDAMILGCYVLPVITKANYSSWVAELCPYAIIIEAARVIFGLTGDLEQRNAYRELIAEQYELLRMSALADVGY